ncbi:TPA: lipid kinase YegS [Vibrio vulnificus]
MKNRLIINGKKAGSSQLREAVKCCRQQGVSLEVRVTWEQGDVERFCDEAFSEGFNTPHHRLIIAGGDGSIHEIVNAVMRYDANQRPSIGIVPLGTANDFAKSCGLPDTLPQALNIAVAGDTKPLDIVKSTEENRQPVYFVNMLTAGFGAQVTVQTPVELKNMLGGGAYTLSGLVQAAHFKPFGLKLESDVHSFSGKMIAGALCNGRFAGGGQELGKNACLDDGMLQVCFLKDFPASAVGQVLREIAVYNQAGECNGEYLQGFKCQNMSVFAQESIPTNLDGEPHMFTNCSFTVLPKALNFALPRV